MNIDKKIENLAEEILQEYTNCYSEVDKEVLEKMISKAIPSKQSEWISVEDRLPETDDTNSYTYNVLVFIPEREGCRQHGMYLAKLKYVKASDGKDNFWNIPTQECEWTVWGWSYFEHPVVTHWMPLPEAPKMKGGEE